MRAGQPDWWSHFSAWGSSPFTDVDTLPTAVLVFVVVAIAFWIKGRLWP